MKEFHETIKKICIRNNIKFSLLSKDWVIMLEKNNKTSFITGYKFSLNDHALGNIIDDKYALYCLLTEFKIPVVEHNILYDASNTNDYANENNSRKLVYDEFMKNNKLIIKINNGTCGKDVYKVHSIEEIDEVLDKLFQTHSSISYCPYYDIKNEYRVIVLNKKIKILYKKIKPLVEGDGKKTIKELLLDFNKSYFSNKQLDRSFDKVLGKGKKYEYDWRFNLSKGAKASFEIDTKVKHKLESLTRKVLDNLDINFASIDIIEENDNFRILEINSGVMMKNLLGMVEDKKIIEDIYEEAILTKFSN